MDLRWQPANLDSARAASVIRHPTANFADVVAGTSTDGHDLTAYATQVKHTSKDADVTFSYHTQLNGAAQPKPGELLELQLNGQLLWIGVIESISSYHLQSGARSLSIKAYTRENMPAWKDIKRVTSLYAAGTPVNQIASDVAAAVGLLPAEIAIPLTSTYTVHSNLQLANMGAWEMLIGTLLSSGITPFIDARGVLKGLSRDLGRQPDIMLTEDRIQAINGSKARSPVSSVRIRWLDPNLTEVVHQDQALGNVSITAGFFQLHQRMDVWFSADHTQRAKNTYMVVKQSANSGLLPVCSEDYIVFDPFHGQIQLTTAAWAPLLATTALATIITLSYVPDAVAGFVTVPEGRVIEASAQVALMLIMMSIGTGMYEVRGLPYDLVNARNRTEATAAGVPDWLLQIQDIDNDFVMNEQHAQAFAVRELIYQSRAAQSYSATIVDDPRIEPGDILGLYDGSAIYVLDYSRTLTYGSPALLTVHGFECSAKGSAALVTGGTSTITGTTTGAPVPGGTAAPGVPLGHYDGTPLRVSGNAIVNDSGVMVFRGANLSGMEAAGAQGNHPFYGVYPNVTLFKSWNFTVARIPLNAASVLGLSARPVNGAGNGWASTATNADPYGDYMSTLHTLISDLQAQSIAVILDMHWTAPQFTFSGATAYAMPLSQSAFMDGTARAAWAKIFSIYGSNITPLSGVDNHNIMFEAYNEPFLEGLGYSGTALYDLMKNGGTASAWSNNGLTANVAQSWTVYGYQEFINDIVAAGAQNVCIINGPHYAKSLSHLASYMPNDPRGQLAGGWHPYSDGTYGGASYEYPGCFDDPGYGTSASVNNPIAVLQAGIPLLVTEDGGHFGPSVTSEPHVEFMTTFTSGAGISYIPWAFQVGSSNPSPSTTGNNYLVNSSNVPTVGFGQIIYSWSTAYP